MNLDRGLVPHDRLDEGISASTFRSTSSDTRIGKARKMSVMRISTSSNIPPR